MPAKIQRIKWTVSKAATEFGYDKKTIVTRLKATGASLKGTLTTRQIVAALYGDASAEKLRLMRSEANIRAREDAVGAKELVSAKTVQAVWSEIFVLMREKIISSRLSEDEKADLLATLREIPPDEYFAARVLAVEDRAA